MGLLEAAAGAVDALVSMRSPVAVESDDRPPQPPASTTQTSVADDMNLSRIASRYVNVNGRLTSRRITPAAQRSVQAEVAGAALFA